MSLFSITIEFGKTANRLNYNPKFHRPKEASFFSKKNCHHFSRFYSFGFSFTAQASACGKRRKFTAVFSIIERSFFLKNNDFFYTLKEFEILFFKKEFPARFYF